MISARWRSSRCSIPPGIELAVAGRGAAPAGGDGAAQPRRGSRQRLGLCRAGRAGLVLHAAFRRPRHRRRGRCRLTIPLRLDARGDSLLLRMEHALAPWIAYLIVPLFGFANAGVALARPEPRPARPLPLADRRRAGAGQAARHLRRDLCRRPPGLAQRPAGASWAQLWGMALLCGIGFTMSLFIGALAFPGEPELVEQAKLGVLAGSLASALAAMWCCGVAGRSRYQTRQPNQPGSKQTSRAKTEDHSRHQQPCEPPPCKVRHSRSRRNGAAGPRPTATATSAGRRCGWSAASRLRSARHAPCRAPFGNLLGKLPIPSFSAFGKAAPDCGLALCWRFRGIEVDCTVQLGDANSAQRGGARPLAERGSPRP